MDIGVRELKQHLSEYLERAAQGEVIRVTDRGEPKALLCPLPSSARLDDGVRDGWIRAGDRSPPARVRRQVGTGPAQAWLDDDRGA
jgi:prevent-host-death family protein